MGKKILILCTGNSCRSQIAEGYLRYFIAENNNANTNEIAKKNDAEVYSAGIETHGVNPKAIATMCEDGIDISQNKTKDVFEFFKEGRLYHYVVTVCDEASAARCPIFPGVHKKINWSFTDPSSLTGTTEEKLAATRAVRDKIKTAVQDLISFMFVLG